ncbi:MAG: SipW-dependent-type signal peptide-containing protein [Acidimicrobiales bacterium]
MISRVSLAAGALGVGALTLALVGPGSFASFTSSVTGNNSITSGTFQLQALPSGSPTVSGPLIGDAINGGQPSQSLSQSAEPSVVGQGNTLSYSLANANPGDTYTYAFSVYDVGSLQGQVNTITYNPGSTGTALEGQMTVALQEDVNGTWTDVHTTAQEKACEGCGSAGSPLPANGSYTYNLDYGFGPSFLQPNTITNGVASYNGEEASATYRVQLSFLDPSGSQNSVEGSNGGTATPTIMVNGTNTP